MNLEFFPFLKGFEVVGVVESLGKISYIFSICSQIHLSRPSIFT